MSKMQRTCIFRVLALALLFSASSLMAQIITGEITGTVTDQSGGAVPGAQISAVCTATNATRVVTTMETGTYRVTNLPVCLHKITVSVQGFKTEVRQAEIAAGIVLKVDFQLQVGQKSETVNVEAVAPLVDYSPGVTNEVDTKAIVDLPSEGRDFKSILAITPGVQRSPGGGFLDVSNSGTNDFHGTAFYFGDYDWLNAKNFFTTQTTPYHNHNYGGTFGGPLVKNRLFFFSDFEGQRNKSLEPYQVLIPTQGDLAKALANFSDPTINPNGLPLNPAGLALLKYYPCSDGARAIVSCTPAAANLAVATGGFSQTIASPNTDSLSSFKIKLDFKMNAKMQLTGRYVFADSLQSAPLGGYTIPPAPGSGLSPAGFNSIAPTRVQVAGLGWTYTVSANKILDVRF